MTRFNVNASYFQHSTPEYNRKHKEENSEYNHEYYEKHKEKWQDNDEDSSKSWSSEDDEKDSKDKKSGSDFKKSKEDKIKSILGKLNGGSKKGGSATGKSSSKKSGSSEKSSKKSKETDEEKKKREEEEKAEKERLAEEERKKNSEAAENARKMLEANAKYIEAHQQGKKKAKPKTIKHAAVYVGINSQPYFEHHGRLGMKWGKRNGPPYPLDYSKLSEEERAKDKQRVKEEGDIESVGYKKNRSYFSDQEINEVINRYQLNQRINQLSADSAKMKAGKSKTEQLVDNMAKVADVGNKLSNALNAGTNVYNNVAKIMNAFGDSDMPIIGQEKKKEKTSFTGDIKKVLNNIDSYSDDQLANIAKRVENINKIGSKVTLDNFRNNQQPTKAEIKAEKKAEKTADIEARKEAAQQQKAAQKEAQREASFERQREEIRRQNEARAEKQQAKAEASKDNYDPEKTQRLKEQFEKATREARDAESNYRKDSSDLNYREAAVKDARQNLAQKALYSQLAEDNKYGKPENYNAVQRLINKSSYEKAVERDRAQKEFAEKEQLRRLEAEERAIEEERRKRGQEWAYEWLD